MIKNNQFKNIKWQTIATIVIFIIIYVFIIKILPWNLIFKDTMVAGGDTGAHNYTLYHLKSIFPTIKTWTNDWYAGFPFLYFYPPLMFILSVIWSYLIPLNIAFKLATLLGTFLLPIALYWCLKNCNQKFPIPELGALGALFYIFVETFSIYGANLPSTLAGEFSYSFSFAIFFIFLGFIIRGLNEKKFLILNILLLTLMVLSHPLPVIVAVLTAPFLMFIGQHNKEEYKYKFWYLVKVFGGAFCLTAWWSLPFLAFRSYTSIMHWTKIIKLEEIFPNSLIVFWIFAGLGIIYAITHKEKQIWALIWTGGVSFLLYYFINNSSILNARFLPFVIVSYILLGAYGLGKTLKLIVDKKFLLSIIVILLGIGSWIMVKQNISFIPDWLKWNYEGFEAKIPFQTEAIAMFQYLKTLPKGGIMWECKNEEYDTYGTPIFLENLPIWTNHPTYEGLLIESSLSGPFHFVNQAEVSKWPSSAIAGFDYPVFDFEKGIKHLQMFGAKYFLAYTSDAKNLADQYLIKLNQFEHFGVYEIPNSKTIELIKDGFTLQYKHKKWVYDSFDWYTKGDLNIPILFYKNIKEKNFIEQQIIPKIQPLQEENIQIIKQTDTQLQFTTNNLYRPHIIKISYFPDWTVKGAYGPYLISPSFMVVFPYQNNVTLEFKAGIIDWTGYILSLTSFVFLCIIVINKHRCLNKKLINKNNNETF